MSGSEGYTCTKCGEWHDDLPFSYHASAPAYWTPDVAADESSELGEEQCVIQGRHFFVRGLIRIPVTDSPRYFEWGVWVSVAEDNFVRMNQMWGIEGREAEPPVFGWLSTALPTYTPPTLNLKTMVHTSPVGIRPFVQLEATDHPLAIEQRRGIPLDRVRRIAEVLLHDG